MKKCFSTANRSTPIKFAICIFEKAVGTRLEFLERNAIKGVQVDGLVLEKRKKKIAKKSLYLRNRRT